MKSKYDPQQILYAINTYEYKDELLTQNFYCIEKVIIESINIDINKIEYWLKSTNNNLEWGICISENMLFTTKELAAKEIIKLCKL